ncbi:MAG: hypothetical protein WKF78_06825 [Candidatus Limnocylindrales bacterium]
MTRPLRIGVQLPEVEREVRWPELLDMIRAIEDLGYDSIWVGEHLLYRWAGSSGARPVGGMDLPGGDRRGDLAGQFRAVRGVHQLPQPGPPREAGRDDRRDQRRAFRPGPRRRVERAGIPRLRLSRSITGSIASRRRSRSSAPCSGTGRSTSTAPGTRPATANSYRARRGPAARP